MGHPNIDLAIWSGIMIPFKVAFKPPVDFLNRNIRVCNVLVFHSGYYGSVQDFLHHI
jgi:hypothetical protein